MDTESGSSTMSTVTSRTSTSSGLNAINNLTNGGLNQGISSSFKTPNSSNNLFNSSITNSLNGIFETDSCSPDPSTPPSVENLINITLPREQFLRIFSYLDVVSLCRAAQVSRYWNELARDGSNWQSVNLFSFQRDITPSVIGRLSSFTGGFLHSLSLEGCKSLEDDSLNLLAKSCPNLQSLNLTDCKNLSDNTCIAIASYCVNLRYLNLSGIPGLTDVSLEALASSIPIAKKLTHLDLSFCSLLTSRGLLSFLSGPSNASIAAAAANIANSALTQINNRTNEHLHATNSLSPSIESSKFIPFASLSFFAAKMVSNRDIIYSFHLKSL